MIKNRMLKLIVPSSVVVILASHFGLFAQAYVAVRTDGVSDLVYVVDQENGYTKIQKAVEKREGSWDFLKITDQYGYISVFAGHNKKKGIPLKYFISYGKDTSAAAVKEARDDAIAYTNDGLQVWSMRTFRNTNKFKLEIIRAMNPNIRQPPTKPLKP